MRLHLRLLAPSADRTQRVIFAGAKTAISFTPEGLKQSRAGTPAGCKWTSALLSGGVAALNRPANGCNASGVALDNLEVWMLERF